MREAGAGRREGRRRLLAERLEVRVAGAPLDVRPGALLQAADLPGLGREAARGGASGRLGAEREAAGRGLRGADEAVLRTLGFEKRRNEGLREVSPPYTTPVCWIWVRSYIAPHLPTSQKSPFRELGTNLQCHKCHNRKNKKKCTYVGIPSTL